MRNKVMQISLPVRKWQKMLFLLAVPVFLLTGNTHAQNLVQVTGQVTESSSGEALPGVSILVKGTTKGTITDIDGRYLIEAASNDVLVFSFVGYLNEELRVGTNTTINVALIQDIIGLDEVVVTGYGVQRKSDLTGSIASVSGEEMTKMPSGTFDEALKGRAAGVFSTTESGAPGSNPVIRIRGISSINGGDPFIVIDGVPSSIFALSALNPSDIKSVEILKDASSQAIYGASGGNGVIIISTKGGDPKGLVTEVNYVYGLQNPYKFVEVMNTEQFFEVYNQLDIPAATRLNWSADTIAQLPDIDWQKELLQNAPMHNVNLSVAGGNDRSTFRFSTGYFYQDGVVPNSKYKRFNARINSLHSVTKRIKFGENLALAAEQYSGFEDYYYNHPFLSPVNMAVTSHPFVTPYIEGAGDWDNWGISPIGNGRNPFMYVDITDRDIPTYRFDGDLNLSIDFIKGLTYKTILGGNMENGWTREFTPVYFFSPQLNNNTTQIRRQAWRNYGWYWQHTLTYNFTLASAFNFTLMGGFEAGYFLNEGIDGTRYNLINDSRLMHYFNASLNADDMILTSRGIIEDVANYAYFGRINADYKGKYLLTSNIRKDYSSRFGPNYRSGTFPSISVGWKFSEEAFMQNLSWLSFGKIRAGWGEIGNSGLDAYRYYARVVSTEVYNYPIDNSGIAAGSAPHGVANPELRWEAMQSTNVGVDLTFFSNRLSITADYFRKTNDGMIMPLPIPDLMGAYQESPGNEGGATDYIVNLAEVENKGFDVSAGFKNISGQFKHDFNVNFSYVQNEVGDINNDTIITGQSYFYSNLSFTAEGHPMGQFYGYVTDGLFRPEDARMIGGTLVVTNQPYTIRPAGDTVYAQPRAQPGDVRFKDLNDDGRINQDDRAVIGNPHPKFLLGINYNLSWKAFDFSMFWQGAFGHDIMMITKAWLYNNAGTSNWTPDVANRYTDENTDADLFRLSYTDANDNDRMSDFFIEPGDYLRLKNIQVGYTLPKSLMSRVGVENLRIYVGAKDLITFTNYPGVDPEVAESRDPLISGIDVSAYPRPRVFHAGISATF
jgi:TonB-dependent starch-binding outer membrane protein SusC